MMRENALGENTVRKVNFLEHINLDARKMKRLKKWLNYHIVPVHEPRLNSLLVLILSHADNGLLIGYQGVANFQCHICVQNQQ